MLILKNFDGGDVFKRLAKYYYGTYTEKQELIISCLHEIILLVTESFNKGKYADRTKALSDSDMYRSYVAEQYMHENFTNCKLEELAQILHLSYKQTQRIFKRLYGHTFSEYISILKMQYAKELLEESDFPIWEIAEKTSYKSPHNFYSAFKKHFKTTPCSYRKTFHK